MKLALTNLTLVDRAQDTLGPRAEPYILFTFFKIDGVFIRVPVTVTLAEVPQILLDPQILIDRILDATISINLSIVPDARATPNAGTDASRGTFGSGGDAKFKKKQTKPIPAVGTFNTALTDFSVAIDLGNDPLVVLPLTGLVNTILQTLVLPAPAVGVVYVLLERDRSAADTIAAAHSKLNTEVATVLTNIGVDFSAGNGITLRDAAADPEVIATRVRDAAETRAREVFDVGSKFHPDDILGFAKRIFSTIGLVTPQTPSDPFDNTNNRGRWRVDYRAEIVP